MRAPKPRPVRPPLPGAARARRGRLAAGTGLRLCLSSAPARDAARIARLLVRERAAACVSLVSGVVSVYRWKGRVERAPEVLLLAKTTAASVRRCVALLAEAHPYEVPEILVATPGRAAAPYAAWVQAESPEVST